MEGVQVVQQREPALPATRPTGSDDEGAPQKNSDGMSASVVRRQWTPFVHEGSSGVGTALGTFGIVNAVRLHSERILARVHIGVCAPVMCTTP